MNWTAIAIFWSFIFVMWALGDAVDYLTWTYKQHYVRQRNRVCIEMAIVVVIVTFVIGQGPK